MSSNPSRPSVVRLSQDLAALEQRVRGHRALIEDLARKSQGNTRANRQVALIESRLMRLEQQLEAAVARFGAAQAAGDSNDPRFAAVNGELARLNTRLGEYHRDLTGQMAMLQGSIDAVDNRVVALEHHPNNQYDLGRTTVDSSAETEVENNWLSALIVGAVAGVLMYAGVSMWDFLADFRDNRLLVSIIVALAVAAIAAGMAMNFVTRVTSRLNLAEMPAEAPQQPLPAVVPDPGQAQANVTTGDVPVVTANNPPPGGSRGVVVHRSAPQPAGSGRRNA